MPFFHPFYLRKWRKRVIYGVHPEYVPLFLYYGYFPSDDSQQHLHCKSGALNFNRGLIQYLLFTKAVHTFSFTLQSSKLNILYALRKWSAKVQNIQWQDAFKATNNTWCLTVRRSFTIFSRWCSDLYPVVRTWLAAVRLQESLTASTFPRRLFVCFKVDLKRRGSRKVFV